MTIVCLKKSDVPRKLIRVYGEYEIKPTNTGQDARGSSLPLDVEVAEMVAG